MTRTALYKLVLTPALLIFLIASQVSAMSDMSVDEIIGIAISGVGSKYVWGGACWNPNDRSWGGADCSGYVGKCWQVPRDSPVTENYHPYSTWNFYYEQTGWYNISRSDTERGDAMVYRSGDSGHIILFDSGDPWGSVLAYEAKGTAYGIVHAWRTPSTSYQSRRRMQLIEPPPPPPPLDSDYHARWYVVNMAAGSTATVWVEYENIGEGTWTNSGTNPVRLGTWNPQDRSSAFYTPGDWIGPNRPTSMDQSSVASGGIGRFTFVVNAPETPGTHTEYWRLVKEGVEWFGEAVFFMITVVPTVDSISAAKALPDGTMIVLVGNVVSADFSSHFYIQSPDRASGIRVEGTSPDEGREVSVMGRLTTIGGERALSEATVTIGARVVTPSPILLTNRNLGGADLNPYTPGVTDGVGAHNLGLLVATTGRVTHVDSQFCYVDDGSDLRDGSGFVGAKVNTSCLTSPPSQDQHVRVTGISSVEIMPSGDRIRLIRPRRDADAVSYQ